MDRESFDHNKLVEILEVVDEGIVYQEADGRISLFNQTAQRIFGISEQEALRRTSLEPDWHLINQDGTPCQGPEHPSMITLRTGQPLKDQVRGIAKPGQPVIWLSINTRPVTKPGRESPCAVVISFSDITERKRSLDEIERLAVQRQLALDTAKMGWWQYDPITRIARCDERYQAIFGLDGGTHPNDEILQKIIHPADLPALWARVEAALNPAAPAPFSTEYRIRRANDGQVRWVKANGAAIFEGEGPARRAVDFVGTVLDITERKRAEDALRDSKEDLIRSKNLLDHCQRLAKVGGWEWDVDRQKMTWTDETYRIHGVEPNEIAPGADEHIERSLACYAPQDRPFILAAFQKCVEDGVPYDVVLPFTTVQGNQIWVRTKATPIMHEGRVSRVIGTIMDITERRRAEEDFKRFFDLIPDLACIASTDGYFIKLNAAWQASLGFGREELMAAPLLDFIHPDDQLSTMKEVESQLSGKETINFVNRYRCKDGSYKWLEWRATPAVDQTLLFASARDITERRNNENRLEWNLRRNALLSETAARLLQSEDPQSLVDDICLQVMKFIDCQAFFNFLEDPGQGKLHLNAHAGIPEQEAKKIEGLEHGVAQNHQHVICGDIHNHDDALSKLLKSHGFQVHCRHPLKVQGRLIGTLSFARRSHARFEREEIDLMASVSNLVAVAMNRITMESRLRDGEAQLRAIFDSAQDVIYLKDKDLRYTHCNAAMTRLFGRGREEIIGKTDAWLFEGDDAREIEAMDRRVLAGQPIRGTYTRMLDGARRIFDTSKAPVLDATGKVVGFCGVSRDITEEVNLREQMRQSQKVEAIGRLAGGVAHDLNNLLSPIIGYGELLLDELGPEATGGEMADGIVRAGVRARDIVRQLLAFSRKQVMDFKALDLNATIRGFEKLLRRTIPEDIRMETVLSPDIQPVMADVGQIEQILMNLAVNAADAMPDGGRLSIETSPVELDEAYAATRLETQPGAYTMIAVSDTGCGMDNETSDKIFEPFFSTKGDSGTGLGLATVFGIVKQHGGNVWVYSEPDKGTTFKIFLPVAEKAVLEDKQVSKTQADRKGSETVLLVEDNEQVRELARAILKRQGYTVLVAMNGEEAIQTLAADDGPVHVLLTDVVMPGMNGRVLYEKVARQHPEMKVIYMSGYTDNVIAHRGVLDQGVQFIQKPFSVKSLAAKVREVLDQE